MILLVRSSSFFDGRRVDDEESFVGFGRISFVLRWLPFGVRDSSGEKGVVKVAFLLTCSSFSAFTNCNRVDSPVKAHAGINVLVVSRKTRKITDQALCPQSCRIGDRTQPEKKLSASHIRSNFAGIAIPSSLLVRSMSANVSSWHCFTVGRWSNSIRHSALVIKVS